MYPNVFCRIGLAASVLLISMMLMAKYSLAEEESSTAANVDSDPEPSKEVSAAEESRQQIVAALAQIAEDQAALGAIRAQRAHPQETWTRILDVRILRSLSDLVSQTHSTAKTYLAKAGELGDTDALKTEIAGALASLNSPIEAELLRLRQSVALPRSDQPAQEQAALIADLEALAKIDDMLLDYLVETNEIAAQLGVDTRASEAVARKLIISSAQHASAYLDVTMRNLVKLRRQQSTLPKNEEIAAKIAVAEKHVQIVAEILRQRARRISGLGMDVSEINAQLIAATGALTTEIFDWDALKRIAGDFFRDIGKWISDNGARVVFQLLLVLLILFASWKVAHVVEIIARRALGSSRVNISQLLQRTIVSTARSIVLVLGLLIGLAQLGVSLGPVLAGLGIAGFVIGFALQDSLSNFASGMMILIYRPFDVGDVVEVAGVSGKVGHMSLVNTSVVTFDNQMLVIPNNQVWRNVIKNLTGQDQRRVDMIFGISYGDDIAKAERVLREILAANDKVLTEPEPLIKVKELGESSVNFIVGPWVKTEDYWDTYWNITREVKLRFDREGISIPFPQRDVHVYPSTQGEASRAS